MILQLQFVLLVSWWIVFVFGENVEIASPIRRTYQSSSGPMPPYNLRQSSYPHPRPPVPQPPPQYHRDLPYPPPRAATTHLRQSVSIHTQNPHQHEDPSQDSERVHQPPSTTNLYTFQGVTAEAIERLNQCVKPAQCMTRHGVYGYALDEYAMIDAERKILMEFTPKADCTAAVVSFLDKRGFEQDVHYYGWPHVFRERYYGSCGQATACMYYDKDWFRFKVVRNPFDRAVSSYLYVMKTPFLNAFIPSHLKDATFEQFIDYQLSLTPDVLQYFATKHAGPQSQYYERFVYMENQKAKEGNQTNPTPLPPIFQEIVKVEESDKGFQRIFEKIGIRYQLKYSSKQHFSKRNDFVTYYVGNIPWSQVQAKTPKNYGYFYNKNLIEKVERLYHWDLVLYNYSFPFEVIG